LDPGDFQRRYQNNKTSKNTQPPKDNNKTIQCFHCKGFGHKQSDCPQKKSRKSKFIPFKNYNPQQQNMVMDEDNDIEMVQNPNIKNMLYALDNNNNTEKFNNRLNEVINELYVQSGMKTFQQNSNKCNNKQRNNKRGNKHSKNRP